MTLAEAVNIFFEKTLMEGDIPFDVKGSRYNKENEAAIKEAKDIMNGKIHAKTYFFPKNYFRS